MRNPYQRREGNYPTMGSEESHESRIARGAGFLLVATVLSTGLGFLIRTFLIRRLPTVDYGLFALALAVSGAITTVGTLGLRQGVARTVSRCETESEVRNVTLTAITSTLAVTLLFSGILVVFAEPLANEVIREDGLAPYLQVVGALVPGTAIQSVVIATFRGKSASTNASWFAVSVDHIENSLTPPVERESTSSMRGQFSK